MPSTVYSAGSFPSRSMRLRMSMNFSPRRSAIRRSRRSKASMRAFFPVKYGSLRASSRGSGLWIKTCVAGDSAAMRSSRRSYCRSSASGAMVENIRSLTPAMRNIARGRPATMLSSRAAMPATQSPPMPRLITCASGKYSAQAPRSVRLLPSITVWCGRTGRDSC